MKVVKKKIKVESVNKFTGEVHKTIATQVEHVYRRPLSGYKGVYMKRLADIVDLTKPAQRLLFSLIDNVDDYNRLKVKWNCLVEDDAGNISRAKKELMEKDFVAKIYSCYVLNPFVVLPRYQTQAPEYQGEIQQIYERYIHDIDTWYDGIDEDAEKLYK